MSKRKSHTPEETRRHSIRSAYNELIREERIKPMGPAMKRFLYLQSVKFNFENK